VVSKTCRMNPITMCHQPVNFTLYLHTLKTHKNGTKSYLEIVFLNVFMKKMEAMKKVPLGDPITNNGKA